MCKVLKARQAGTKPAADRVYVGRPSKWGNPFVIGRDGSRDGVIAKYRAWIVQQPALMAALPELRNKDLVCWCAPLLGPAHGNAARSVGLFRVSSAYPSMAAPAAAFVGSRHCGLFQGARRRCSLVAVTPPGDARRS